MTPVFQIFSNADKFQILEFAEPLQSDLVTEHYRTGGGGAWTPPPVRLVRRGGLRGRGRLLLENDFPRLASFAPCYTRRAVEAFGDRLEQSGPLYKLDCVDGDYWLHEPKLLDALDVERSTCVWVPNHPVIMAVKQFAFVESALAGAFTFRLPQVPLDRVLVTAEYRQLAEAAKLRGIFFREIWPNAEPDMRFRV